MRIGTCVNEIEDFDYILDDVKARIPDMDLVFQLFVRGPKTYTDCLSRENEQLILENISRGIQFIAHCAYISNPWSGSPGAVHNLKLEIGICRRLGISGLVLHLGNGIIKHSEILENVAKHILEAFSAKDTSAKNTFAENPTLWFEINSAKTGFETPEKLAKVMNILRKSLPGNSIGLCIDTAHLFACGFSCRDYAETKRWLKRTRAGIPRSVPFMFHLNDSFEPFASGKDRHAGLGAGNIWSDIESEMSGIKAITEFSRDNKSIIILEQSPKIALSGISVLAKLLDRK